MILKHRVIGDLPKTTEKDLKFTGDSMKVFLILEQCNPCMLWR